MIDWERLVIAVLCTAILLGVCIVLTLLPNKVLLVLAVVAFVCMIISALYKALGDNSDKDKNGTDKD
jgi:predicted benzoate:H+ symporter BenE